MNFFDGDNVHLLIAIVISVINGAVMCFLSNKFLHVIQLSGYKINGYRAWLKETKGSYIGRLVMLCFLSVACVLVTNALLDGYGEYYSYVGLIFYLYFCTIFIINVYQTKNKTPLKQTKRMNRLTFVVFLAMSLVTFFLIAVFSEYVPYVKFGIVALTPLFLPFIIPLCHLICVPLETIIRNCYIKKAKNKLNKYNDLIKIGITGSYGKTTTKHILNVMLAKKYSVCMSPHSFNTPLGLTKVINSYLKPEHEVLIAEMGARQIGDITNLCKLIEPKHGIITGVGNQHLATFKTKENVYKAKSELMLSIKDGICCFNGNNEACKKMYEECKCEKILCGLNDDSFFANITDIETSNNGSKFKLTINKKTVDCSTKLLGIHNLYDIAVSAGLAYKLGVTLSSIKSAIHSLKPIAHRFELIEENGFSIIDNSYNSSVESSSYAIDTLKMFNGDKIVVTPGIIEMGDEQFIVNQNLGIKIAEVAQKIIIVNLVNKDALLSGIIKAGFNEKDIILVDNISQAKAKLKEIVKQGDTILFENDLPDNYI